MKFFNLLTTFMLILFVQMTFAQTRTITGTVTDPNTNEPIVGATVIVPGSTIGTVTDLDGKYELKVPEEYSNVQISFIGYKAQTFDIGSSNVIDAALGEDILGLEEVVVTAIGISREKKALGYAVQEVGGEELTGSREANVVNALAGKVAGVQINNSSGAAGGSSFIRIRGTNTIRGDNQPLFVVDGIPIDNQQLASGNPDDGRSNQLWGVAYSNRAIDIPQQDIESLTVLKGAAATALYGSQAGNGAIIITTKRGKKKVGGGLNVTFNSSVDFLEYNKMHELQNQWGQGLFGGYSGPETGSGFSWGPAIDSLVYLPDPEYIHDKNGRVVGQSENPGGAPVVPYDNINNYFKTGVSTVNNLSISSANDISNFFISLGYENHEGIIPNNNWTKGNVSFNGSVNLSPKLQVGTSVKYINSGGTRIEQGSNVSGVMLGLLRTSPTFDNTNGLGAEAAQDGATEAYMFPDGTQRKYRYRTSSGSDTGYDNPFWTSFENPLTDRVNRIIGNFNISYDFTDWLNLSYRIGADFYNDRRKQRFAVGSRTATAGRIVEDQYFNMDFNADLILAVDKQLSDDFRLVAQVGNNMRSNYLQQLYVQGDDITTPGFYHISTTASQIVRENILRRRDLALFGQAELDYKRMLYLTLTYRREWSTSLPEGNNRFNYPSASVAVDVTEALGLTDSPVLPYAKLRASWAKVGLGSPFLYATKDVFVSSTYGDGWTSGIAYPINGVAGFDQRNSLGNPDLDPEEKVQREIGLETKFFNNRFGFDISYFSDEVSGLIFPVPIAPSSGYTSSVLNSGRMTNKGLELLVNVTPVQAGDFSWDIDINYTRIRNKVEELAEGVENVFIGGFLGASIRAVEGEPYGSMFGNGFYRDASGARVIGTDGFPIIDPAERSFGSAQPDWYGGLRNTFAWKGFSLSALLDFRSGGILWNGTKGALYFWGTHQETAVRGTSTVFEGNVAQVDADGNLTFDDNGVPITSGANSQEVVLDEWWLALGDGNGFFGDNSEDFIEEVNWLRLRELTLSYTLPASFLSKTFFTGLDITVTGRNVFLDTDYTGIDPETSLMGADNAQGLEYFNMPNTKSWGVGLRASF